MNLLSLLLGSMMTQSSVNNLSGKTGTSQSAIMRLLPLAIPILIKYLTKNAQSQQGALSLLGALTQHKNTNSMELQLADADADDGNKILNHILGGNYGSVMNQLAGQSGMSEDQEARAACLKIRSALFFLTLRRLFFPVSPRPTHSSSPPAPAVSAAL